MSILLDRISCSRGGGIIEVEKWREGTRRIGEIRTAGFNTDQSSICDSGMGAAYGTAKSGASVDMHMPGFLSLFHATSHSMA